MRTLLPHTRISFLLASILSYTSCELKSRFCLLKLTVAYFFPSKILIWLISPNSLNASIRLLSVQSSGMFFTKILPRILHSFPTFRTVDATNSHEDACHRDHPDGYRDGRISFALVFLHGPPRGEAPVPREQSSLPERDPRRTRWRSCRTEFGGRGEKVCQLECRKRGVCPLP